jgi:hypothetical protein
VSQTEVRPSAGVRYALTRVEAGEGAVYRGFAHLTGADAPLEVRIAASGAAEARVEAAALPEGAPPPADLEREAAALVKAAVKAAITAGRPPPRRITRWRA